MYHKNKLKTRVFQANSGNISDIPLEDIGALFKSLAVEAKKAYETKRQLVRERLELDHIRKYNETHEDSYEGDFEFLDADVETQVGRFRGLGSDQIKEFEEAVFDLAKSFNFAKKGHVWFFPQAQAYLVENLKVIQNEDGTINAKKMYNSIYSSDPKLLAIIEIFKITNRGPLLGAMTSEECRDYSKLVPLTLAAYKRYANIPYSKWDGDSLWFMVEAKLADAMTTYVDPADFPAEDILAARDDALTVKSGENMGSKRSAVTTYMLYPSGGSIFYGVNTLLQHIMGQTWCAHPSNRSKYAILDTNDWDNQKIAPLVSTGVIRPAPVVNIDEVPFE